MQTRLVRMLVLVMASAGAALALSAPSASAAAGECVKIAGSGSSLQNLAQQEVFIPGFEAQKPHSPIECDSKIEKEPKQEYKATSSGKGLNCWGAGKGELEEKECNETTPELSDFIGTDVAPEGGQGTTSQIAQMDKAGGKGTERNTVVAMPIAQSAITIMVTLPENCEPHQQKQQEAYPRGRLKWADIESAWYQGQTKMTQLKMPLEPSLCQAIQTKEVTLFARSSPSGTTGGFKRFLDQIKHSDWETWVATAAKAEAAEWPNPRIQLAAKKGKELAEKVWNTPNSMGYADLADARAAGFSMQPTQHKLGQGKVVSFIAEIQDKPEQQPNPPEYQSPEISPLASTQKEGSNCLNAKYANEAQLKVGRDQDWSGARQVNELTGASYSICTLTFDVAWGKYGLVGTTGSYTNSTAVANTVLDELKYIVSTGQEGEKLDSLHFAPLPKGLKSVTNLEENHEGVQKENIEP